MFKGNIYITNDLEVVYNIPVNSNSKIVSLDEDDILPKNDNFIGGTCLLPPMEAKIAEADGNEQLYDSLYSNHLLMPFQQEYITALISYLYKGGNLVLFLPEIGYTNTMEKFITIMYITYGIHIGLIGNQNPQISNCYYDNKCIPIWLNMMLSSGVLSPNEFLYLYPLDAVISNKSIMVLIELMKPYGETLNDKMKYIVRFHKLVHKNPNVVPAIYGD